MRIRALFALSAMVLAAVPALGAPPAAREVWLPPAVEDGAARQLAARMGEIGFGGLDEAQALDGARQTVDAMATQIETMGEEGVLENAPTFPGLELPRAGQRHLDAMAGYQMCNVVLFLQHAERDQRDENSRVTAVVGLTSIMLAVVSLRHPFLAEGHEQAEIEAFLTGPAMNPPFERIQQDPTVREAVEDQCTPALLALLAFMNE